MWFISYSPLRMMESSILSWKWGASGGRRVLKDCQICQIAVKSGMQKHLCVKAHWCLLLKWSPDQTEFKSICFLMRIWMEPTVHNGGRTHLDTREKASAHTAGHGTSLIITCSLAALKCALVTFSSTEVRVATSPFLVLGSPPAVSKMWPPCTTSSSTCVLHFLCWERGVHREKVM